MAGKKRRVHHTKAEHVKKVSHHKKAAHHKKEHRGKTMVKA